MISVIITCFKEGKLLLRAIDSLKKQTRRDFEIIVVKDYSNHDETNNICNNLETQGYRVLWSDKNIGLSGARNMGIEVAKGSIIVPLDADDTLPIDAIEIISKTFEQNESIDMVFGNYRRIDLQENKSQIIECSSITNEINEIDPVKLLQNWILLGTSPFKKEMWENLNGYSIEFSHTCQDVDFFMRALLNIVKTEYVNALIYEWHKSAYGMSARETHRLSLSACYYNNYEYILNYATNNDGFLIPLMYLDGVKLKRWAAKMRTEHKDSFFSHIINISPLSVIPLICRIVLFFRRQKSK